MSESYHSGAHGGDSKSSNHEKPLERISNTDKVNISNQPIIKEDVHSSKSKGANLTLQISSSVTASINGSSDVGKKLRTPGSSARVGRFTIRRMENQQTSPLASTRPKSMSVLTGSSSKDASVLSTEGEEV